MSSHRMCGLAAISILAIFATAAATARAEDAFSLPTFSPSIFGGRALSVDDASTPRALGFGFGVYYDYAPSLLTYFIDEEPEFNAVDRLQSLYVNAAIGILDWWAIGVQMPMHAMTYRDIDDPADPTTRSERLDSGLLAGDMKIEMKFRALVQERHAVGLAIIPFVRVPTGESERFVGEGQTSGGARLAVERDFGPVDLTLGGGYLARGTTDMYGVEIGDALLYGAAIGHDFENGLGLGVELSGRRYRVEDTNRIFNAPLELLLKFHYRFGAKGPRFVVAGGPGLTTGIGTPPYRAVAGIDYFPPKATTGALIVELVDEAGVPIAADVAVTGPDFESAAQRVTQRARWELAPGVYSIKATAVGRVESVDSAAVVAGKKSSVRMQLPKFKAVETGVAVTVVDQCTKQPAAGRVVLEGGEELFLVDGKASRNLAPGDYRGTLSAAGYPDREFTFTVEAGKTTTVEIEWSASTSELSDKIPFAVGSAEITTSMEAGLDKVAAAIRRSCALKRVVVQGHTDESENPGLGERRAQAVRDYLVGKGVDAALLSMEGLGATRPMASNAMAWGREQNRRVEFRVEE